MCVYVLICGRFMAGCTYVLVFGSMDVCLYVVIYGMFVNCFLSERRSGHINLYLYGLIRVRFVTG